MTTITRCRTRYRRRLLDRPAALLFLAGLCVLTAASCGKKRDKNKDSAADQPRAAAVADKDGPEASAPVIGEPDPRSQYDLAAAIKTAETAPPDEADSKWNAIRRDYHGKRLTWTVFYAPALCTSHERCHVVPFDRTGKDKAIVQGWMPRLEMSPETFAELQKTCAGKERCQFRFEGVLYHLTLSADHLTSLHFKDVKLSPP